MIVAVWRSRGEVVESGTEDSCPPVVAGGTREMRSSFTWTGSKAHLFAVKKKEKNLFNPVGWSYQGFLLDNVAAISFAENNWTGKFGETGKTVPVMTTRRIRVVKTSTIYVFLRLKSSSLESSSHQSWNTSEEPLPNTHWSLSWIGICTELFARYAYMSTEWTDKSLTDMDQ